MKHRFFACTIAVILALAAASAARAGTTGVGVIAGEPTGIDVIVEIVPVLDLFPDTGLDVDAAIGVRFWFR